MNELTKQLTVTVDDDVRAALQTMESTRFQVVFVVDGDKVLKGLITNGDIRRHLLAGGKTEDRVSICMNQQYRSVGLEASREEILKLLDLGFHVVPRVDDNGSLVDLILLTIISRHQRHRL